MFDTIKKKVKNAKQARIKDDVIVRMARLKALIGDRNKSGWDEYEALIRDYLDKCKKRKLATRLDIASPEDIRELQLLDHEIYILGWIVDMPHQYIERAERELDREKRVEQRNLHRQKA